MIELEKQDEVKYFNEVRASDLTVEKKVELVNSLPEEANNLITAEILGYRTMPPRISEFLTDDYYAKFKGDSLYPFWWDVLKDFYCGDSPFYTSKLFSFWGGSVGIGKSTISQIVLAYNLVRGCCMKDWFALNKLEKLSTSLAIMCFNTTLPKSEEAFCKPLRSFLKAIPFLNEHKKKYGENSLANRVKVLAGSEGDHGLSICLYSACASEINSFSFAKGSDILDKSFQRISSRNFNSIGQTANIIIDAQAMPGEPIGDMWLEKSGNIRNCFKLNAPHWRVRSDLYKKNSPESPWFYVYAGDETRSPTVMDEGFNPDSNPDKTYDRDRFLLVPYELKNEFLSDTRLALAQKGGITTGSSDRFLPDKEEVIKKFVLPQEFEDVYTLDFYKDSDYCKIFLPKILDVIPKDVKIAVHIDIGLTGDKLGFAIGYCSSAKYTDIDGKKTFKGKYHIPVCFAIKNKPGQENNIVALTQLIVSLSKVRDLIRASADSFQSRNLKQSLLLEGIDFETISMDRPVSNYCLFKNLLMQGDVELPKNSLLLSEALGLSRIDGGKVDHGSTMDYIRFFSDGTARFTGDLLEIGSKDSIDAAAGVVCNLYELGEAACATVEKEKKQNKSQLYSKLAERNRLKSMRGQFGFY